MSEEKNHFFNLISHQSEIDNSIFFMLKMRMNQNIDWVTKKQSAGIKHFNDFRVFIKSLNDMDNIYKNIEQKI